MYLISSFFWWNTFVHLLKRELNHILEIQCDLSITLGMDENARINYLSSILKVIRAAGKNTSLHNIPMNCAALVSTNKTKKLSKDSGLCWIMIHAQNNTYSQVFCCVPWFYCYLLFHINLLYNQDIIQQPKLVKKKFLKSLLKIHILQLMKTAHTLCMQIIYRCDIEKIDEDPFSSLPIKYSNKNDID